MVPFAAAAADSNSKAVFSSSKALSVGVLVVCQVAAMALWFSGAAVVPVLVAQYGLSGFAQSLLSSGVQAGFVIGCIVSAVLGLPDRIDPRRLFTTAALVAAGANALIVLIDPRSAAVPLLRLVTGICMAGIYPVGMKMVSTWAKGDMGLMVGLLVGALTLGSATPHLFSAFGGADWRATLLTSSSSALVAALLINLAGLGPNRTAAPRFDPRAVFSAWTNKSLRLANLGYLGHMWELYAMWAWIGVFLHASFGLRFEPETASTLAKLVAFATVAAGALGCIVGGVFADRLGRTTLTMLAMAVSGTCAIAIGLLYGADPVWLTALCLIWGVTVVADSAQFSASIAELSEPARVGTMLTLQTALGFTLTLVTIHLMPLLVERVGWRLAFMPLAVGPFLGVWAMARLRASPASVRLAGGRR